GLVTQSNTEVFSFAPRPNRLKNNKFYGSRFKNCNSNHYRLIFKSYLPALQDCFAFPKALFSGFFTLQPPG
ncbi:MAG: hypothetical protein K2J24_08205, partial [Muribaculaceae bacterium]|nr:hypothetical protein [Muribaculaceae bacterium]